MDEFVKDKVYGVMFNEAQEKMEVIRQEISNHYGTGFVKKEDLINWAHMIGLDKLVFSNMNHAFYNVSHKGELINKRTFLDYYGNVLFIMMATPEGKEQKVVWSPNGFEYMDKAYVIGEQSDGIHKPLYYRDYFVPPGFYSQERDAFNVAKPFKVFARETGRDTSHIYTFISHVAGECAMWLLAWLRAKMMYPTVKTQVVPIFVSSTQGNGKTTFGEVICKGLFGSENVLVTDQYDSQSRFNADYADALIVCQEEKEEVDRRNPAAAIKSRATATTIRKEQKGIDPIYQESYTDFIMTTNKDVPIKFDGRDDQRRFMVMEADPNFTRKTSALADEVFSKLYGVDANFNRVGMPFVEDSDLIAQFKHELYTRQDIADVQLRNFPKTAAYKKCFTLPRTTESSEIEAIMRSLAPFIKESLLQLQLITELPDYGSITQIIQIADALQYMPSMGSMPKYIAICRPLVFYDPATNKPYQHSMVERGIYECQSWLTAEYGLRVIQDMDPLPGGFKKIFNRYKTSPAAKICLAEDHAKMDMHKIVNVLPPNMKQKVVKERIGERFRVNAMFKPDVNGCYETVNELEPGWNSLSHKTEHVQYMDTFLLESDECTKVQYELEKKFAENWKYNAPMRATSVFKDRLHVQKHEAIRLFNEGKVCRVVYSGSKSYHLLVRVQDAPTTVDEYKWLHAYLCSTMSDKITFDTSTADPARLTRSPVTIERISEAYGKQVSGTQGLMYEDWSHVYQLNWRELYEQWLHRPLEKYEYRKGRRLIPSKPEYVQAMKALLDGSFWTDGDWDGRRQLCFFAGYRLCRLLGYSHDELFGPGGIMDDVSKYKNPNEITYWRNRESSDIIKKIDMDIDGILEEQIENESKGMEHENEDMEG